MASNGAGVPTFLPRAIVGQALMTQAHWDPQISAREIPKPVTAAVNKPQALSAP